MTDRHIRAMLRSATAAKILNGWQGPHLLERSYCIAPRNAAAAERPLADVISYCESLATAGIQPLFRASEPLMERRRTVISVATWDDVQRLALALPETSERDSRGLRQWRVKDKLFVWERPLRGSDLEVLGDSAPDGPILGARVEHLVAKEALVADPSGVYFTTPHFDGYPSILVALDRITVADLEEVTTEAWLARAPARLAQAYLNDH